MNSSVVQLVPLTHRDHYCISIRGSLNDKAINVVRNFPDRKYSKTQGCWYVYYSKKNLIELTGRLGAVCECKVDEAFGTGTVDLTGTGLETKRPIRLPEGYHEALISIRYSPATVKGYESQISAFLDYIHPRTPGEIDETLIKRYLYYLADQRHVSRSTQNQAINAIEFYLERVKRQDRATYYIDRPDQENKLPTVLSKDEVAKLIQGTSNLKHRCILLVLYSGGFRISELLKLSWPDIDKDRQVINIHCGKGRKDRITLLSPYTLKMLEQYREFYKPVHFVFEGAGGERYSERSVNAIIKRCCLAAAIHKRVSAHTLRHSFATHLLESGTDIRYIQTLLGHESSKTTERYTHVTKKGFERLRSPADDLGLG